MTHTIRLTSPFQRQRAHSLVDRAPDGFLCLLREPKRTVEQSDKMWAMLTDISVQAPQKLNRRHTPDDWKAIMMNACGWECQFVEGLDGRPFPKGFRSSNLTKSQMSTLIDFMDAWGTENGIQFSDESSTNQGNAASA